MKNTEPSLPGARQGHLFLLKQPLYTTEPPSEERRARRELFAYLAAELRRTKGLPPGNPERKRAVDNCQSWLDTWSRDTL